MTGTKDTRVARLCVAVFAVLLVAFCLPAFAGSGDWPEPRQNPHLTSIQPMPGHMKDAPVVLARHDLGRSRPSVTPVALPNGGHVGLAIVSGALYAFDTTGKQLWKCHPAGLNFSEIVAHEDLNGDGTIDIALQAGRPAQPYGAAVLVSLDDGEVVWRYDVDPMSYSWRLYAGNYLPGTEAKQLVVVMHGYPPDKDNGYIALFEFPKDRKVPAEKWRYDFHEYTCFPSLLQTDLDGDRVKEVVVETHSRMWFLDALTGELKHFVGWDVSPANCRSYGFVKFVDLNGDGREDFLCIGDFAQHHEVLLNVDGKMEKAWSHGWGESVTTGKVATKWPEPPYADLDGDGALELVVSMFNSEGENAWLIRVYNILDGTLEYRFPGAIAVSVADIDGDGACEVLANRSADSTGTVKDGAVLLRVVEGQLQAVWENKKSSALKPVEGAPFYLAGLDGNYRLIPWNDGTEVAGEGYVPLKPPPGPQFTDLPEIKGPAMPSLFAADLLGDERNEVVLSRGNAVSVLQLDNGAFLPPRNYESTCAPAIADLNGDGHRELVLVKASPDALPVVKAVTPALDDELLWETTYPEPGRPGLPQHRLAYVRTGHFTGQSYPDLYVLIGTPLVRSTMLNGRSGEIRWEKGESPVPERYHAPTINLASVYDYDADGKGDLVFTNPDYYCVASGPTGDLLLGPLFPPKIFDQPSQGLYTLPAILESDVGDPTVCLVAGHYFQAAMSLHADPYWYQLPPLGQNRCAQEGFMQVKRDTQPVTREWLMGFGRQNGWFACLNVSDGSVRWELPVEASCSDVATCDIDGDGQQEFIFGTSHGKLYAVGDGGEAARVVWNLDLGASVGAPIVADLDADGASEIVVPTADGYVNVLGQD